MKQCSIRRCGTQDPCQQTCACMENIDPTLDLAERSYGISVSVVQVDLTTPNTAYKSWIVEFYLSYLVSRSILMFPREPVGCFRCSPDPFFHQSLDAMMRR